MRGELGRVAVQQVRGGRHCGVLGRTELFLVRRRVLGPDLSLGVPVFEVQWPWDMHERYDVHMRADVCQRLLQGPVMHHMHGRVQRGYVQPCVLSGALWGRRLLQRHEPMPLPLELVFGILGWRVLPGVRRWVQHDGRMQNVREQFLRRQVLVVLLLHNV